MTRGGEQYGEDKHVDELLRGHSPILREANPEHEHEQKEKPENQRRPQKKTEQKQRPRRDLDEGNGIARCDQQRHRQRALRHRLPRVLGESGEVRKPHQAMREEIETETDPEKRVRERNVAYGLFVRQ